MPLPDDAWTRGKCGFKGLLSMAMGAARVMSPVGVNTEIVRHGENGFLATSEAAWVETLCELVLDRSCGPGSARPAARRWSIATRWRDGRRHWPG